MIKLKYLLLENSEVKTWAQIRNENDPDGKHHDLRLKCVKCGNTETCKCSKPKREFSGLCNDCAHTQLAESLNGDTFQMYHGGKRWSRIPTEILGSAQGRYEAGVGIYFTNDYNTARKYGKGSRVVHLVDIDKNYKDIKTLDIPLDDMIQFIKTVPGMKRKAEIIDALKRNSERMKRDVISAETLNNLIVNFEAGAGKAGIAVANYFVSKGADALLEPQSGAEYWLVVFNPKIIKKVTVVDAKTVNSDFSFMLPSPPKK